MYIYIYGCTIANLIARHLAINYSFLHLVKTLTVLYKPVVVESICHANCRRYVFRNLIFGINQKNNFLK